MKKTYKIASEEGALFAGRQMMALEAPPPEVGDELELEVDMHQEKALIAAGWLEHAKQPKEAKT